MINLSLLFLPVTKHTFGLTSVSEIYMFRFDFLPPFLVRYSVLEGRKEVDSVFAKNALLKGKKQQISNSVRVIIFLCGSDF